MANNRNNPDNHFAWYNDDQRIGIIVKAQSSSSTDGLTSGEYDSYLDSNVTKGLRIHCHCKFEELTTSSAKTTDISTLSGLDSGFHTFLLDYIKSRLYEEMGNIQLAQYHYSKFELGIRRYPSRKSGVRILTVPRI